MNEILLKALSKRGHKDIIPLENDGYTFLRKGYGSPFDFNFIHENASDKMRQIAVDLYFGAKSELGSECKLIFLDSDKNKTLVNLMFFDTKQNVQVEFLNTENCQLTPWINPY